MNTLTRGLLAAALAAATVTTATLTATAAPARTIEGWPRCVTPYSARVNHLPVTPRGAVCATPLVGVREGGGVTYTRIQWRTERWEYLGLIGDPVSGELVADLVRRPR